jgi:signal transduction histidine kinase
MTIPLVLTVAAKREVLAIIQAAQTLAFPAADLLALPTFEAALARPAEETALLVLAEPEAITARDAHAATTPDGLARWPVLVLGNGKNARDLERVGPAEWAPRPLARLMKIVAERHASARESARVRGDLLTIAGRVNHDLRSSLNGVVTACEVVKEMLATNQEQRELVQPIADSANEIARLIDQVSLIAKATATPAALQPLPMEEMVWKALTRVEREIRECGAQVTHAETWPLIDGVAAWLEVIWSTLVGNALAHGGAVSPRIELGWTATATEYRFHVADQGPGVSLEKQTTLFMPFHRLGQANASHGFGLSLVQRLVELQGGRCGYEPRAGGGAHFYFTLRKVAG